MHFGLGLLRLAPAHFWTITPRELMALTGGIKPAATLDRAALTALMDQWPDKDTPDGSR